MSALTSGLLVLGLSKVHAAWIAEPAYDFTGSFRFAWAIGFIVVIATATYAVGLPDQRPGLGEAFSAAAAASAAAALAVSAAQLVTGDALLPRFVVFTAATVNIPIQLFVCRLAVRNRRQRGERDRVLLIAPLTEYERLVEDLRMELERPAVLVGTITVDEAVDGTPIAGALERCGATVVVIDRSAMADDRIVAQAAGLHERGVRIRTLLGFYEEWLGKLPVSELERASLLFDIGELHRERYVRVTRLVDIALSAIGLVALLPVAAVVFLGNLMGNQGSLLYHQTRVGKGGREFTILKFRTMRAVDGAPEPTSWTQTSDPRVTPFGRVLRRSHLDELPQVVNILRGDLSLVGPRPEQPHYVAELSAKLPFYDLRHLVRPGLTGWAQVKYGYAGDERDALEKLQYEFFYLRHQDLRFDLRVMGRTLRSTLGGIGSGR